MLYQKQPERSIALIDGSNTHSASKALGINIDYKKLLNYFQKRGTFLRAYYYTALNDNKDEHVAIKPLIDYLAYNGYAIVTKPTKEWLDEMGNKKIKGNMDIEIAVDALTMAPKIDHMYLFSGDGDFKYVVDAVQKMGVRVTVVSTMATRAPFIADELRRQTDEFIDLKELSSLIAR